MNCFVKDCQNEPCGFIKEGKHYVAWCPEHEKIIDEALKRYEETEGKSLKNVYEYKGNN